MAQSNIVLPTTVPADAIPLEGHQSSLPTDVPADAIPLELPQDAAPVPDSHADVAPSFGGMLTDLLRSVTGAMFGNQVDNATPLGPVVMNDAGEFYKDQTGNLKALANTDFIAPDPKTGALTVFARNPSEGALGKARDVASAMAVGTASMAPEGTALKAVNEAGTAADLAKSGAPEAAATAETAPAGMAAPAPETPAGGAPTGSPAPEVDLTKGSPAAEPPVADPLQARINGLMAGDKQIMSPQQLALLSLHSGEDTAGAAAALPEGATQPIVKEGLSRNVVGAFKDMLTAGKVTMVPGIKPTDQVLALMNSEILPPETFNAILDKWGLKPEDVYQSMLGQGMRESAKLAGQTLQQLSDLQKAILKLRGAAGDVSPEVKDFLANQRNDVGNSLRSVSSRIRGIWMRTLVGQWATSARNALVAGGTVGVNTLAKGIEGALTTALVNPIRLATGAAALDDPIGAFTEWNMLLRSAGRVVGVGDKAVSPYEITKTITDALPQVREALYGSYASDVARATGGKGLLGKLEQASEFLNFHGRMQEYFFRRAFFAAELDRRLGARGLNLDDVVRNGNPALIPEEDLAAAAENALRLTYGRPLGHSAFDNMMRGFNQFQTLGGASPFPLFIPFVRFMADAMKWQFEHSPLGALRLLSSNERAALGPKGQLEIASRALAGSAMLYGAYMLRRSSFAGSNWYSVRVPGTDTNIDTRAFSPISNFLFAADVISRAVDGTLTGIDGKALAQGLVGANFRAGAGLYLVDGLVNDIAGAASGGVAVKKVVENWVGQHLAGFLTPFEMLKDVTAQFSPAEGTVRDVQQNPLLGPSMNRIPGVSQMLPPLASPTRAGPIEEAAPMLKATTGINVEEKQNAAEKELARLGIQRKEVMPSSGDPATDRATALLLGPIVEKVVGNFVTTPQYQGLKSNEQKAFVVTNLLSTLRSAASKALPPVMQLQQQYARKGIRERIFLEQLFNALPPEKRDPIMSLLIRQ